jgi:tetratricopeptide (TPR) repeat protein
MRTDEEPKEEAKKDPIKLHREGTALADAGNYEDAIAKFYSAYEVYETDRNHFDASYTLFKAAECSFYLKDYDTAAERFRKSAKVAFEVGYDRFAISALEYARDCYKAQNQKKKVAEIEQQIKEAKEKLPKI